MAEALLNHVGGDRAARSARVGAMTKLFLAAFSVLGTTIQFSTSQDALGRFNLFSYFTIQSNLVVAFAFIAVSVAVLRNRPSSPAMLVVERAARVWIVITGLAFHFLLSASYHSVGIRGFANALLHYVVPIGAVLEWIILEPKGRYRVREAWLWIAYPFAYGLFSLVRGRLIGFYPYWFVNPGPRPDGAGSWGGVAVWLALLLAAFALVGLVYTGLDRLSARFRTSLRS